MARSKVCISSQTFQVPIAFLKSCVRGRSRTRSQSLSRSPSGSPDAANPGNNLFVTGLSTQTTEQDLEDYFSREGKVLECKLVVDACSKASRRFAFITMDTVENADRCIKYLNQSNLDDRVITVEKARCRWPRNPTSGRYLSRRRPRDSGYGRRDYELSRDHYRSRYSDYSPEYSPYCSSHRYKRDQSPSPAFSLHSPRRGYSRSRSPSRSPYSS